MLDKSSALDDSNGNHLADVGELLDYSFTVTNTGNVTLTGVTVTDPHVTGITPTEAELAPQESVTFTAEPYAVTQADVDQGEVYNLATASGTAPDDTTVDGMDDDVVGTVVPLPSLRVQKTSAITTDSGAPGTADEGDVITYTFTVTNDGLGTAHDVAIADPLPGLSPVTPARAPSIAPGASATFTATYEVQPRDVAAGSVDNQATATYRPPTPRGGQPAPRTGSAPSNLVRVPTFRPATPRISTDASAARVASSVESSGRMAPVELFDRVSISGFVPGGDARGTATLYGPAPTRSAQMCAPARRVRTVAFTPRNGTVRTPSVRVTEPGHYTWVVTITGDDRNEEVTHRCGLRSESTLVHRTAYGSTVIDTGFSGFASAQVSARRASYLSMPALGIEAPVQTVVRRGRSMMIPADVHSLGWLRSSAASGEAVGTTIVAGHVSDRRDRPGAFYKLRNARKGQIVTLRTASGDLQRYRVTRTFTQPRTKALPGSLFSTTGQPKLAMISCAGKVTYANGRFHYTRNVVVVARPVR